MARSSPQNFIVQQDGASTIEFVVIFVGFIAIMLFVVEVTLYLFFVASLEKAAQAGVRAAVVSPRLDTDVPLVNNAVRSDVYGMNCSSDAEPCEGFGEFTCNDATCDPEPCTRIINHMRGFNGQIQPDNVTITYTDVGIGFAGGPTTPMVTVTVQGVPFQTGILGLLLSDTSGLATLPTRSASMTGEDLAQ